MTYVIGASCVDVKDRARVDESRDDRIDEDAPMVYPYPDKCIPPQEG